ncbi:hypothetical protein [Hymenobacter defluvii]|uniref:Uncharacterized protein n=1 Tax=Hymenobacter defluvii TaxID=2054411 RepID=A0ABS3T8F4_9BACT|nr:hypothetical protein [Hymenobacter defluvii]MBO3269912.1 hypothetical protein [Hymenobacter defluvii]
MLQLWRSPLRHPAYAFKLATQNGSVIGLKPVAEHGGVGGAKNEVILQVAGVEVVQVGRVVEDALLLETCWWCRGRCRCWRFDLCTGQSPRRSVQMLELLLRHNTVDS